MKVKQLASNMTELVTDDVTVLFSYETPVAYEKQGQYFRTNKKFSMTTSKHINKWLDGVKATEVNQDVLTNLVK